MSNKSKSQSEAVTQNNSPSFALPVLVAANTLPARIKIWGKTAHESMVECVAIAQQALLHFHVHGDVTAASLLVKEMPLAYRRQALIAWFKASAPLSFSDKTGEFTKDKTKGAVPIYSANPEQALPYIQKAFEKPFYDMFKEPKIELFDEALATPFKSLLNKYSTAKEKGLVQQADKIRLFMDKVRLLQVEAEEIQETIDSVKKDETLTSVKEGTVESVVEEAGMIAA